MVSQSSLTFEKKHLLAEYREDILKALEALRKVAKRVGVPEPTWTIGATYDFEFEIPVGGGYDPYEGHTTTEYEVYIEPVFDISINLSECIKMTGDWRLVAAIHHRAKVIVQIDADMEIPAHYSPEVDTCEHCHVSTPRVVSYLIYSEIEGFKQVGKSCMKQFLGINPTSYISMFEAISKFSPMIEALGYRKNTGNRLDNLAYNVEDIFKITYHVVKTEGAFVKNQWMDIPTGEPNWFGEEKTRKVRSNSGESTIDKVIERIQVVKAFTSTVGAKSLMLPEATELSKSMTTAEAKNAWDVAETELMAAKAMWGSISSDWKDKLGNEAYEAQTAYNLLKQYDLYLDTISTGDSHKEAFANVLTWANEIPALPVVTQGQTKEQFMDGVYPESVIISDFDRFKAGIKEAYGKKRILQSKATYIVSGYNVFIKDTQRKIEYEARAKKNALSQYVGVVGQKMSLALTITGYKTGEGTFGMWELWTMEDAQGNQFKKFGKLSDKYTTGNIDLVMYPDMYTNISSEERAAMQPSIYAAFEIKEHSEYKETCITTLGRISKP